MIILLEYAKLHGCWLVIVYRCHWLVFERSTSLHFSCWLFGDGTTCVLYRWLEYIFIFGLALQAILLLVHTVLSVAHLFKVHYG